MIINVIACPTCGQADCLEKDEEFEYNGLFKCECGEEFNLSEAKIIELGKK